MVSIIESGAIREVGRVLSELGARRVFLVAGGKSYARSGAEDALGAALADRELTIFSGFRENPRIDDVERGLESIRGANPDVVLAVGGGSVLDMAKLLNVLARQPDHGPLDYIEGRQTLVEAGVPLVAVPTTAGSGSQVTHFAVCYVGTRKRSLSHPCMRPQIALVDPDLLDSLPAAVAASTGLDALNQAIESFWSIHATEASKEHARAAIPEILSHLGDATPDARLAMARAAHRAGEAIDVTRTTAPHAISYPITAHFGIPHGHAVGLVLPAVWEFYAGVRDDDCLHPLGPLHVRDVLAELAALFGVRSSADAARAYRELMDAVGLERSLAALGIRTEADRARIVAEGFHPDRVNNGPRRLTAPALREMLV